MNRDDCLDCLKYRYCKEPCLYIDVMRQLGSKEIRLRETLSPPDGRECEDYKKVLIDIQEAKESRNSKYIEKIRTLRGKRKIIAALIHAEVGMEEIAELLKITYRHAYRILRGKK